MKKLTLIDLDSIVYIVAYQYADMEPMLAVMQAKDHTRKFVRNLLDATDADSYIAYYQVAGHKNYRKLVDPMYKANRPETPDYIKMLRPCIHEVFDSFKGSRALKFMESDDAISIASHTLRDEYDITIARIDKDLACLPGTHFNYKTGKTEEIEESYSIRFRKLQILAGDSVDGIPSIPRIGMKTAAKYVDKHESVVAAFREAAKAKKVDRWIELFYKTYHCINLLCKEEDLQKFTEDKEDVNIIEPYSLVQQDISPSDIESW